MHKLLIVFLISIAACKPSIKDENANVIEEDGTQLSDSAVNKESQKGDNQLYGFYVGYFEKDTGDHEKNVYAGEAFDWNRANKINISIDKIEGETVEGHTVVAGNYRPFSGSIKEVIGTYRCNVREPGDDKYDGSFEFTIKNNMIEG